jgi:hypothetical protein
VKVGALGELVPVHGFSRDRRPRAWPLAGSAWRSHDGLTVVSSLAEAFLPGSGEPPLVGPQWLVSVSRSPERSKAEDVLRVVDAFAMPAFDEDNHHPGIARHLWCPLEEQYRSACECKVSEVTIVDGDYAWTTEADSCRGCDLERLTGRPCPLHR